MRLDFLRKREVGYLLLGVAATSALAWFLLYAPAIRELKRLKAEVAARQEAAAESVRAWSEMRASKGAETKRWEEAVARWEERVPPEPMADRLMAEIGAQAVRHGLSGFRLSVPAGQRGEAGAGSMGAALAGGDPSTDNTAAGPAELRYEISFRSSYRDLAAFLDELPRLRRLVALQALQVREDEGAMVSTLSVSAYHRGKP